MHTLVCIPAYNEGKTIFDVVTSAKKYGEVVVCDDGSIDNTAEAAKAAGAAVIKHRSNRGYGAAIKTLFNHAKERNVDVIVTLDSDGQHSADQIPQLLEPIVSGEFDIVIGSRFLTKNDKERIPKYRSFGIKTITKFTQMVTYENITDAQSGFRAYGKRAISRIQLSEEGMAVSTEILIRAREAALSITEVPITVNYDVDDASTHNPLSHGIGVLVNVLQFISVKHPLLFYGLPGIALLIIAVALVGTALDIFSVTRHVSTNMVLLSIGFAIVGMLLLVTGIILFSLSVMIRSRFNNGRV